MDPISIAIWLTAPLMIGMLAAGALAWDAHKRLDALAQARRDNSQR